MLAISISGYNINTCYFSSFYSQESSVFVKVFNFSLQEILMVSDAKWQK